MSQEPYEVAVLNAVLSAKNSGWMPPGRYSVQHRCDDMLYYLMHEHTEGPYFGRGFNSPHEIIVHMHKHCRVVRRLRGE